MRQLSDVYSMTPDDLPIREPDQIRQDCARKLRAVQVSDQFQAILGCLLAEDWTTPRLVEMVITPDGHLLVSGRLATSVQRRLGCGMMPTRPRSRRSESQQV